MVLLLCMFFDAVCSCDPFLFAASLREAKFVDRGFRAIRDGRTSLELQETPPVASIVEKRPTTPATATPVSSPVPESV